jgi:hypothetical protein
VTGSFDFTTNSYIISNGCPQYRDPTNTAIVILKSIVNPFAVLETDPIQVIIKDKGLRVVSQLNAGGATVTTVMGTMNVNTLTADDT